MKSEEIDKVIKEYLEYPGYVFSNYKNLLKAVEESEKDLTEDLLRSGLEKCKFKAPDVVALQCMIFPPLHFDIIDRVIGGTIGMIYKGLMWFILFSIIFTLIDMINKPDIKSLIIILFNLLSISIVFRINTKRYNTLEFIYHILHCQGKI